MRSTTPPPDVSPDGRWIVYSADDGGQTIQLELLDLESGESHSLTRDSFIYTDPVFSPDGSQLAYVSTKPSGYFNVYLRAIKNGQWAGEGRAVTRDNSFGRDRLYFGEWDMHITPAWLRDGKELLLVTNQDVPLGSGNVVRVPAEANGIDEARTVLAEQTLYRTRPDVSIDGKRFVYSSTRGAADQFLNLYVQPTVGGEPYKMTFFQHDAFHPRWSPDGEWIAYISNEGSLPQLALLETYGGKQETLIISDRRWRRPTGVLSVRTLDAETQQTTGSRVHLTGSDGKFYAPSDAYARLARRGDYPVFHTTGNFELTLPVGKVKLTVVKGFEFWPEEVNLEIAADQVTEFTVSLKRMTDMAARGWYSGSTHVHMNYGGNLHNTPENLMKMSEAEDQDVVNELIANKDNRILDYQFFVPGGGPHPLSTEDQILVVGEEYRPPFYGHVFMLGLEDHLISPFTTGYEGTAIESLYPSNTDMFRKAKEQGATVGYVHAFRGEEDPLEGKPGWSEGSHGGCGLGNHGLYRVGRCVARRFSSALRHLEQWSQGHRDGRRGLDQRLASDYAHRLGSNLRPHQSTRSGYGRLVRGVESGALLRLHGTPGRAQGFGCPPRRDGGVALERSPGRDPRPGALHHSAPESSPGVQRPGRRGDPPQLQPEKRRLQEEAIGHSKRLVPPSCRGISRGALSPRCHLRPRFHESRLGDGGRSARQKPRCRRLFDSLD